MENSLLEFCGLGFRHPHADVPLFENFDFALRPGERVGLVGPNGCGKSTLFRLIVGLLQPTAGELRLFGEARCKEAHFHEVRARVGLVFQDADDQLFCPTVLEDLVFGPLNLGHTPENAARQAAETLSQVGLAGFENRVTYRLSGGQKRLVSLACVLTMRPDILLLDEPTGGLDEAAAERVLAILKSLPQAMIVVSHDKPFLSALVQRTITLPRGES